MLLLKAASNLMLTYLSTRPKSSAEVARVLVLMSLVRRRVDLEKSSQLYRVVFILDQFNLCHSIKCPCIDGLEYNVCLQDLLVSCFVTEFCFCSLLVVSLVLLLLRLLLARATGT